MYVTFLCIKFFRTSRVKLCSFRVPRIVRSKFSPETSRLDRGGVAGRSSENVDVEVKRGNDRVTMHRCLHRCCLIRSLNKDPSRNARRRLFTAGPCETLREAFPIALVSRARDHDERARAVITFRPCRPSPWMRITQAHFIRMQRAHRVATRPYRTPRMTAKSLRAVAKE